MLEQWSGVPGVAGPHLLDGPRAVGRGELPRHPPVPPHLDNVLEEELDPGGYLRVVDDGADPVEVLVHPGLGLDVVEQPAAGLEEVREALHVLALVRQRLLLPTNQELLGASMEDRVVEHLHLAELGDELDVTQHLPLGQELRRLLLFGKGAASLLESWTRVRLSKRFLVS